MGWMLLLLIGGGVLGFFIGERSYPSHDEMREAARALVPDGAYSVVVYEKDGWEPLVGRYEARATYEGGGRDRTHHFEVVTARAIELGWQIDAPIDHPGGVEIRVRRPLVNGAITLPLPPVGDLNGRLWITYDEGIVERPWIGAVVGSLVGALSGTVLMRRIRPDPVGGVGPAVEPSKFT